MKAGPKAYELIRHFEGLRLQSYRCMAGVWTIGYGHTGAKVEGPRTITRDEAERLLEDDVDYVARQVSKMLLLNLKQNEFDALVSLAFNIGIGSLKGSTLMRLLNLGQRKEAGAEFWKWNKVTVDGKKKPTRGLTLRRDAERELFMQTNLTA